MSMKAIMTIEFTRIAGFKVKENRINEDLIKSTDNTIRILCKELKDYFKSKHIKTSIDYEIKTD